MVDAKAHVYFLTHILQCLKLKACQSKQNLYLFCPRSLSIATHPLIRWSLLYIHTPTNHVDVYSEISSIRPNYIYHSYF